MLIMKAVNYALRIDRNDKNDMQNTVETVDVKITSFDRLTDREELYMLIDEGLDDVINGNVELFDDVMCKVRMRLSQYGV